MGLVIHDAVSGELFAAGETAEHSLRKTLALCVLGVGYFGTIALGFAGLAQRGMLRISWVLFTIPLYWLFMFCGGVGRAVGTPARAGSFGKKPPWARPRVVSRGAAAKNTGGKKTTRNSGTQHPAPPPLYTAPNTRIENCGR
jgi:hypothetical protein